MDGLLTFAPRDKGSLEKALSAPALTSASLPPTQYEQSMGGPTLGRFHSRVETDYSRNSRALKKKKETGLITV
jgi:hypothetical protein